MEQSFSINGKAKSTLNNYLRCLAHLTLHYKESPETLSVENIEAYLYYCQKLHKTPSESFFKHTIFGLRAAYKVMGMEAKRVALPQIKRDLKLPIVLSKEEVRRLLKAPKYLKHRLVIGMLYGCGLRSYELCNLKLADIDFDRKTVFIPKKKGKIDRYVPLSKHLITDVDRKNRKVTFTAKDYRRAGKKANLTLSNQEFIRRFALHILPKGFTRIRHYGILSSSWKKEKLPKLQAQLATDKWEPAKTKQPLLHRRCPTCKKRKTTYHSVV